MKSLSDFFADLFKSGASYEAETNSFQVKPENIAVMQANDWAEQQRLNFADFSIHSSIKHGDFYDNDNF